MRFIINVKIKSNKQIISPNINKQIETNPTTMSETINKFFSTIAKDIDNKIILFNKTHKDYLNGLIVNSFFLTPVNNEELESLTKEMNTSKSVGPYRNPPICLNSHAQSYQCHSSLQERRSLNYNNYRQISPI